jgi:hypothetical protein
VGTIASIDCNGFSYKETSAPSITIRMRCSWWCNRNDVQGESRQAIFNFSNNGYSINTGIGEIDSQLNRGGIQSMMWTISLILIALAFGEALKKQAV